MLYQSKSSQILYRCANTITNRCEGIFYLFSRCLDISCAKEQIKWFKDLQDATRCWVQGFRSEEEKEPTNAAAEPNGWHLRGHNDWQWRSLFIVRILHLLIQWVGGLSYVYEGSKKNSGDAGFQWISVINNMDLVIWKYGMIWNHLMCGGVKLTLLYITLPRCGWWISGFQSSMMSLGELPSLTNLKSSVHLGEDPWIPDPSRSPSWNYQAWMVVRPRAWLPTGIPRLSRYWIELINAYKCFKIADRYNYWVSSIIAATDSGHHDIPSTFPQVGLP